MKQTLFETRERAKELLKEAAEIWRHSDYSESLEDLEKDPVFTLLMNALAYQENELESDIERLREEILEDFSHAMTPFEIGHAVPASAVIETLPRDSEAETVIDGNSEFLLNGEFSFIPLLSSKVFNVKIGDVERLDGRRWKVTLEFQHPVSNLSGFSFAIKNAVYRSVNVKIKGSKFHLIRPWNYTELPFSQYFNPESLTYNHGEYYSGSMLPMDLFVRQNIRMFWIEDFESSEATAEYSKIDLIIEFTGIADDFIFDAGNLALNTILLVNASVKEATISSQTPIVRIAGYSETSEKDKSQQFLHLIKPLNDLLFFNTILEVRRVAGDRFNQGALVKMLNSIVNKYHTDFYAFQNLEEMKSDRLIYNLQELVSRFIKLSNKDLVRNMAGVYLLLQDREKLKNPGFSLELKYLTTSGSLVNHVLNKDSKFKTPGYLNDESTRQIATPVPGTDEINSEAAAKTLLKYYVVTGDRIVTPADMKLFCLTELQRQYSLGDEMVKSISVAKRPTRENFSPGYEICVDITLAGSPMVKKSLAPRLPMMEIVLQKMMEVRSTGIYPIRVNMTIIDN